MANIRFNLANDRSGNIKYITLIYSHVPGQRIKMSTKLKCTPDQWCMATYRVNDTHPQAIHINTILTKIERCCNDVKLRYLAGGTHASGVAYRNAILKIIDPDAHQPKDEGKKYHASVYWSRFWEIVPTKKNFKEAYEMVESEWNEVGINMFPTYEAFRAGKNRYHTNKKNINRAKSMKNY